MSNVRDEIVNYLISQGLQPKVNEETGGIFFKYQMLSFYIIHDEEDAYFLRIALPGIFDADENNRVDVLEACNAVNDGMKVAKCYIYSDSVWVATEQLLDQTPDYEDVIPRSLNILMTARQKFYKALKEL